MGRIVAIASGDLGTTRAINEYAIKMIMGTTRKVLFVGTASHDAPEYIENFIALPLLQNYLRRLNLRHLLASRTAADYEV